MLLILSLYGPSALRKQYRSFLWRRDISELGRALTNRPKSSSSDSHEELKNKRVALQIDYSLSLA